MNTLLDQLVPLKADVARPNNSQRGEWALVLILPEDPDSWYWWAS